MTVATCSRRRTSLVNKPRGEGLENPATTRLSHKTTELYRLYWQEEFEDDEESSDGDSEDDLELTDASEEDDVVVPAAKRGGARSTVGRDAKHGLKRSSAEKPAKRDSASKDVTAMGKGDARRKGSANVMDVVEEVPAVRDNGGMKGVASRVPNGVKRESKSRGTEGGGVAKVKIVGVKTGSSRSLEVRGGAGVENGDASRERNNKKRRRIQESDDDSSGAEEVREVEKPPRKKKEVRWVMVAKVITTHDVVQIRNTKAPPP